MFQSNIKEIPEAREAVIIFNIESHLCLSFLIHSSSIAFNKTSMTRDGSCDWGSVFLWISLSHVLFSLFHWIPCQTPFPLSHSLPLILSVISSQVPQESLWCFWWRKEKSRQRRRRRDFHSFHLILHHPLQEEQEEEEDDVVHKNSLRLQFLLLSLMTLSSRRRLSGIWVDFHLKLVRHLKDQNSLALAKNKQHQETRDTLKSQVKEGTDKWTQNALTSVKSSKCHKNYKENKESLLMAVCPSFLSSSAVCFSFSCIQFLSLSLFFPQFLFSISCLLTQLLFLPTALLSHFICSLLFSCVQE